MTAVQIYSSFDQLPQAANHLFEAAGSDCFFQNLAWYRTFAANALDPKDRVRLYCVDSPHQPGFPAAVVPTCTSTLGSLPLRARRLRSLSSYYTALFSPVWQEGGDQYAGRALANAIACDSLPWDVVELKPLDIEQPFWDAFVSSFKSLGFLVQTFFCFGNWYLPVCGRSFAEYQKNLPSAARNTLNRKRKKLEATGKARTEIVTGGEKLESAIHAYEQVYRASWKQPEPFPEFVPALMRTCAEIGSLRLGIVHFDGEPAAVQFWIVHNGVASIYKLAYDERFLGLSVGTILTAKLMEYVLDVDRVREVDYLTGDDKYKRDWMSHRRERWGIIAMNRRSIHGALSIAKHVGGRGLKRMLLSMARFPSGTHKASTRG
jgi:GNAT acetyltransferase-like protein